jgi:hypothetical protein
MIETDVTGHIEFNGKGWRLYILGKPFGPEMDATAAGHILWWFGNGGVKDIPEMAQHMSDKAWKERDIKNGSI